MNSSASAAVCDGRASGAVLRYRQLFLRNAARYARHRTGFRSGGPAHRNYHADPAAKRHVHLPYDVRLAAGYGHGRCSDQEPHQGQRPVCLELLVPVHVVRRFHWTCSNIRNIARFRSILTYILSSCCSQKGVRPLFCGIGLQALFTGRRSLPTSTNP